MATRECGFSICKTKSGRKVRGKTYCGTEHNVTLPNDCPVGTKRIALTHNHPSNINPLGSSVDRATARKHGVIVCVKTRKVRCFKVKNSK